MFGVLPEGKFVSRGVCGPLVVTLEKYCTSCHGVSRQPGCQPAHTPRLSPLPVVGLSGAVFASTHIAGGGGGGGGGGLRVTTGMAATTIFF